MWQRELDAALKMKPAKIAKRHYEQLAFAVIPGREPTAATIARFAEALFLTE